MEFIKKNLVVVLAFMLPIAFIVIIALVVYLPSLFLSTNYNFLYASCNNGTNYDYSYDCNNYLKDRYAVIDNKLVINDTDLLLDSNNDTTLDNTEKYTAHIFLYDTEKNESREVTFEEAQTLTLNSLLTSPDGVTVSGYYDRSNNGVVSIFGGSSSSYNYYIAKGRSKSKLNLINNINQYYNQGDFKFIGWVLPGRN